MSRPLDPPTDDERPGPPGPPRWVKAFGAVALVLVLLFVVLLLSGRGHGPGRHAGAVPPGAQHVQARP